MIPTVRKNMQKVFLKTGDHSKSMIWKKLREAKEKGLKVDVKEIFGESKGLSWKNLQSTDHPDHF